MKYLGISGKIGVGKSKTSKTTKTLLEQSGCKVAVIPFGYPVKKLSSDAYAFDYALSITEAGKDTLIDVRALHGVLDEESGLELIPKNTEGKYCDYMLVRKILQHFGTEIKRKMNPNYWLNKHTELCKNENADIIIIDDVRMPNELNYTKLAGMAFRINPYPGWVCKEEIANHLSETALDSPEFLPLFDSVFYPNYGELDLVASQIVARFN